MASPLPLQNIGVIFSNLVITNPLTYFTENLAIKEAIGNKLGAAGTLTNIGTLLSRILRSIPNHLKRINLHIQYTELLQPQMVALTLNNIGSAQVLFGQIKKA